jgi:hypothetical protein
VSLKLAFELSQTLRAVVNPIIVSEHFVAIALRVISSHCKTQRFQSAEHAKHSLVRVFQILDQFLNGVLVEMHSLIALSAV